MITLELFQAFLVIVFLGLVGAPWAAALARGLGEERAECIVALAPATGLMIVSVAVFPLYFYFAPVGVWARPIAVLLVAPAFILVGRKILQTGNITFLKSSAKWLRIPAAVSILSGAMAYAVDIQVGLLDAPFQSNPSDALTYLTLSESLRTAPFDLLWDGRALAEKEETLQLVERAPVALYSARFLGIPIRLATMGTMAWIAELLFFEPEQLLRVAIAVGTIGISVQLLGIFRLLNFGATSSFVLAAVFPLTQLAVAVRFSDSVSQWHAVWLLLAAFVYQLILVRGLSRAPTAFKDKKFLLAWSLAAALTGSGIATTYTEFFPIYAVLIAGETALGVAFLQGKGRQVLLAGAIALAAPAIIMLATGQAGYHIRSILRQLTFVVKAQTAIGDTPLDHFYTAHPVATLLGLGWVADASVAAAPRLVSSGIPISLAALFVIAMIVWAFKSTEIDEQMTAARAFFAFMGSMLVYVAMSRDYYSLFKTSGTLYVFLYIACLLPIARALIAKRSTAISLPMLNYGSAALKAGTAAVALVALFFPVDMLTSDLNFSTTRNALQKGKDSYYFSAIRSAMQKVEGPIAFCVPPSDRWYYSIFTLLFLQEHQLDIRSGFPYDNNDARLFLTGIAPKDTKFAVVPDTDFPHELLLKVVARNGSIAFVEFPESGVFDCAAFGRGR